MTQIINNNRNTNSPDNDPKNNVNGNRQQLSPEEQKAIQFNNRLKNLNEIGFNPIAHDEETDVFTYDYNDLRYNKNMSNEDIAFYLNSNFKDFGINGNINIESQDEYLEKYMNQYGSDIDRNNITMTVKPPLGEEREIVVKNSQQEALIKSGIEEYNSKLADYNQMVNMLDYYNKNEIAYEKYKENKIDFFYGIELNQKNLKYKSDPILTDFNISTVNNMSKYEMAEKVGKYYDAETGKWEDYSNFDRVISALNPVWMMLEGVPNTIKNTAHALGLHYGTEYLLPGLGIPLLISDIDNVWGGIPEPKMYTVNADEQGNNFLVKTNLSNRQYASQEIVGLFPERYEGNYFGAFLGNLINQINPAKWVPETAGTYSQFIFDAVDAVRGDDIENSWFVNPAYDNAIALQNYGDIVSYDPSLRAQSGGMFGTWESGLATIGSFAGQGFAMSLPLMGKGFIKVDAKASMHMLTMMGVNQFNKDLNDRGVDRGAALIALPFMYGMLYATESLGPNLMYMNKALKGTKLGIGTLPKSMLTKNMIKAEMGINKGTIVRQMYNRYVAGAPKTFLEASLFTGIGEMPEEFLQTGLEEMARIGTDYWALNEFGRNENETKWLYENGYLTQPQATTSRDYINNSSFIEMVAQHSGDILYESVKAGLAALASGPIMSLTRIATRMKVANKNATEQKIVDGIAMGKYEQLVGSANALHQKGLLGSKIVNVEGKAQNQVDGNWISENDFNYQQVMATIESYQEVYTKLNDDDVDNNLIAVMGHNKSLVTDAMVVANDMKKITKEIQALEVKENKTDEDKEKIDKLKKDYDNKKLELDYYTVKYKDSGKSQAYFDFTNKLIQEYTVIRSITEAKYLQQLNNDSFKYAKKDKKGYLRPNIKTELSKQDYITPAYNKIFEDTYDKINHNMSILSLAQYNNKDENIKKYNAFQSSDLINVAEGKLRLINDLNQEIIYAISNKDTSPDNIKLLLNNLFEKYKNVKDLVDISEGSMLDKMNTNETKYEDKFKESITTLQNSMDEFRKNFGDISVLNNKNKEVKLSKYNKVKGKNYMEAQNNIIPEAGFVMGNMNDENDIFSVYGNLDQAFDYMSKNNYLGNKKDSITKDTDMEYEIGYYLGDIYSRLANLKRIQKEGGIGIEMSAEEYLLELQKLRIAEAIKIKDILIMDRYGNTKFSKVNKSKFSQWSKDNGYKNITTEAYDRILLELEALEEEYIPLLQESYSKLDLTEDNYTTAIESRMKLLFFRDIFGFVAVREKLKELFTKNNKLDVYNNFMKKLNALVSYDEDNKEYKTTKYDLKAKDLDLRNNNENGVLSSNGLKLTEELMQSINELETIITSDNAHDIFMSEEVIKVITESYNEVIHGLNDQDNVSRDGSLIQIVFDLSNEFSLNGVGYKRSSFDYRNENNSFNPMEIMREVIMAGPGGETSYIKPISNKTVVSHTEGSDEFGSIIPTNALNSFSYKYSINYLSMLGGKMTTADMYKKHAEQLQEAIDKKTLFPLTLEQSYAKAQIDSFNKGGNIIFKRILDAELEYFKESLSYIYDLKVATNKTDELKNFVSKEDILRQVETKFRINEIENAIQFMGDYGTGKTEMIPSIIKDYYKEKLDKGEKVTVMLIANTDKLLDKNYKNITDYFVKLGYNPDLIEIKVVNTRDLLEVNTKDIPELAILDESSLLPEDFFTLKDNRIRDKFKINGSKLVMAGDIYQMSKIDDKLNLPRSMVSGIQTMPLTKNFRTNIIVINKITDYFRKHIFNEFAKYGLMPEVSWKYSNNNNLEKIGVQYFGKSNMNLLIEEFINDKFEGKSLVVPTWEDLISREEYKRLVIQNSDGKYEIREEFKGRIFSIIDDLSKPLMPIQSVQGLGSEHLYIAIDYNEYNKINSRIASKMMYTAIGRSEDNGNGANYVAMIGDIAQNKPAEGNSHLFSTIKDKDKRDIQKEMQHAQHISESLVKDIEKTTTKSEDKSDTSNKDEYLLKQILNNFLPYSEKDGITSLFKLVNNVITILKVKGTNIVSQNKTIKFNDTDNKKKLEFLIEYKDDNIKSIKITYDKKDEIITDQKEINRIKPLLEIYEKGKNIIPENIKNFVPKYEELGISIDSKFVIGNQNIKKDFNQDIIDLNYVTNIIKLITKSDKNSFIINKNNSYEVYSYDGEKYIIESFDKNWKSINTEECTEDEMAIELTNEILKVNLLDISFNNKNKVNKGVISDTNIDIENSEDILNILSLGPNGNIYPGMPIKNGNRDFIVDRIVNEDNQIFIYAIDTNNKIVKFKESEINQMITNQKVTEKSLMDSFGEITNNEETELNKTSKNRTEALNKNAELPLYLHGSSVIINNMDEKFAKLDNNKKEIIRTLIQNVRRRMLVKGSYSNIRIILTKAIKTITDSNGVSDQSGIYLVGEINKSSVLASLSTRSEKEVFNEYEEIIMEALSNIGFIENLLFNNTNTIFNSYKDAIENWEKNNAGLLNTTSHLVVKSFLAKIYESKIGNHKSLNDFSFSNDNDALLLTLPNINSNLLSDAHALELMGKNEYKSYEELRQDALKRGFIIEKVEFLKDEVFTNPKIVVTFSSSYGTTTKIIATPGLLGDFIDQDNDYYNDNILKDLKECINKIKSLKNNEKLSELNKTRLQQLILSNFTYIINTPEIYNELLKYIKFKNANGKYNIIIEPKTINDLLTYLEKPETKLLLSNLRVPIKIVNDNKELVIADDQTQYLNFNVKNINAAGGFVDVNEMFVKSQNNTTNNNGPQRRDMAFEKKKTNANEKVLSASIKKFENLFKRFFGDNWQDFVTFSDEGTIFVNGKEAYGAYRHREQKIELEIDSKGDITNEKAVRHEIGHWAFRNISDEKRNLLKQSALNQMKVENRNISNLTDEEIEHYIVEEYQEYGTELYDKKYKGTGIISKFKRFANKLFNIFHSNTLSEFFDQIESGEIKNQFVENINFFEDSAMEKELQPDTNENSEEKVDVVESLVDKKLRENKTTILKDLGQRMHSYEEMYKLAIGFILDNSFLSGNGKSYEEAIKVAKQYFLNVNTKGENKVTELANTIININGKDVKISEMTAYDKRNIDLNSEDGYKYILYNTGKYFDFIVKDAFGYSNNNSLWRYDESGIEKDINFSIDKLTMISLSNMKYYKKDGELFKETNKYIDTNDIIQIIKDFSVEINNYSLSNKKSIIESTIKVLKDNANKQYGSSHIKNEMYSISVYLNKLNNNLKTYEKNNIQLFIETSNIIAKVETLISSNWTKEIFDIFYDEDNNFRTKLIKSDKLSKFKYAMKDSVSYKTFDKNFISNKAKYLFIPGEYNNKKIDPKIVIDNEGLKRISYGGKYVLLIDTSKGYPIFTENAKNEDFDLIVDLFSSLGLRTDSANIKFMVETDNDEMRIPLLHMNGKNNGERNSIAELLFGMYGSLNQWAQFANRLDMQDENADNDVLIESFEKGEVANVNVGNKKLNKYIEDLFNEYGMSENDISDVDNSDEETYIGDDKISYYKPSDFNTFFTIVAELQIVNDNRLLSTMLYDQTGKRIPIHGYKNNLISQNDKEFELDKKEVNNVIRDLNECVLTNNTKLEQTIWNEVNNGYIGKNYKIEKIGNRYQLKQINPLNKDFRLSKLRLISSFKDKSSTNTVTANDLIRINIDSFFESVLNQEKNGLISFSLFNIADRNDVYMGSISTFNEKLIEIHKVYTKEENKTSLSYDVILNKEKLNNMFSSNLDYYKHCCEMSIINMNNIFKKVSGVNSIIVEKYIGTNFNIENHKLAINEINKILKKNKDNNELRLAILGNLIEGQEYKVVNGEIVIGNHISFNNDVHSIWNIETYDEFNKQINIEDKFKVMGYAMQSSYVEFSKMNAYCGYKLNSKYSNIKGYPGTGYYLINENKEYIVNPLMYGFHLINTLTRPIIQKNIIGDFNDFDSGRMLSKRMAPITTNTITATEVKLPGNKTISKINSIVIDNIIEKDVYQKEGIEKESLAEDGFTYGTLIGRIIIDNSLGGNYSNQQGSLKKTLILKSDALNSGIQPIKHVIKYNDNNDLKMSYTLLKSELTSLDIWSDIVNKELAKNNVEQRYDFKQMFLNNYSIYNDYEKASQKLYEQLMQEEYNDIILNNAISFFATKSTVKSALTGYAPFNINNISDMIGQYDNIGYPQNSFNISDQKFIVDLNKDVNNIEEAVIAPNQLLSISSLFDNDVNKYSSNINRLINDYREKKIKEIKSQINKIKVSNPNSSTANDEKMLKFFRNVVQSSISHIEGYTNLRDLIMNPNISLLTPSISEDLNRFFRGYLNDQIVKIKMNGFRGTLLPANQLTAYSCDGGKTYYFPKDLKDIYDYNKTPNGDEDIIIGDKVFVKSEIKHMRFDENNNYLPGEIVCYNPMAESLNINENVSLKSMFVFGYSNNAIDLQNEKSEVIANKVLEMLKDGTFNIESKEYLKNYDELNDDIIMYLALEGNDNLTEKEKTALGYAKENIINKITDFYDKVYESLNYIEVRIPTGSVNQASSGKIVGFINNKNNVYKSMKQGVHDDSDVDGDQNQFYFKSILNEEGVSNKLFEEIFDAISDSNNREKIDRISDTHDIVELITPHIFNINETMGTFSSDMTAYSSAKPSSESIGIFAAMISASGELAGLDSRFNNIENISLSLGAWLQTALNSFKNTGIGELNVPEKILPIITSFIVNNASKYNTVNELNEALIEFITNPTLRPLFNKIAQNSNIDNEYVSASALNIIYKEYKEVSIVNIKEEEIIEYRKKIALMQKEVSSIKEKLAKMLDDNNMNGMWSIIKNKKVFRAIVKNYDVLQKKSEEYLKNNKKININDIIEQITIDDELLKTLNLDGIKRALKNKNQQIFEYAKVIDDMLERLNVIYNGNENDSKSVSLNSLIREVNIYNKQHLYGELYKYSFSGEAIRIISRVINLRNGIKNRGDEARIIKDELETLIGMKLKDLIDLKNINDIDINTLINFKKSRNRSILLSSNSQNINNNIEVLKDVTTSLDIIRILKSNKFKKYMDLIKLLDDPYLEYKPIRIEDHKIWSNVKNYLEAQLFTTLNRSQQVAFDKTIKAFILDFYYKGKNNIVNISPFSIEKLSNGNVVFVKKTAPILEKLNLNTDVVRKIYKENFPDYYDTLKELSKVPEDKLIDQDGILDDDLRNILKAFRENKFLEAYESIPYFGKKQLRLKYGFDHLNNEMIRKLQLEYEKMPDVLKDMIFHYENCKNVFSFKEGSIKDVIPNGIYGKMKPYLEKIPQRLDTILKDEQLLNSFMNRFLEIYSKQSYTLRKMPYGEKATELSSEEILNLKVLPGDQSNKTGYQIIGTDEFSDNGFSYNNTIVNQSGKLLKPITNAEGYESNTNISIFVNRIMINKIPLEDELMLYNAALNNETYEFTLNTVQLASYSRSNSRYVSRYGVPLSVIPIDKDGSRRFRISNVSSDIEGTAIKYTGIRKNAKYVNMGGTKDISILLNNILIHNTPERVIVFLGNTTGHPKGRVSKMLFSGKDTFRTNNVSTEFASVDSIDKVYNNNSYQLSIMKAKTQKEAGTGNNIVSYDNTPFTLKEIKEKLKNMVITAQNNPKLKFILTLDLESDSTEGRVYNAGKKDGKIVTKKLYSINNENKTGEVSIVDLLADIYTELNVTSIPNIYLTENAATKLNEKMMEKGAFNEYLKTFHSVYLADLTVQEILDSIDKRKLSMFLEDNDLTVDDIINYQYAQGIKMHIERGTINLKDDNHIEAINLDRLSFDLPLALYYIYSNNGFSLTKNFEGAPSTLYQELLEKTGDPVLALRIKSEIFEKNSDNAINNWNKIKKNINDIYNLKVPEFSIEDVIEMIKTDKIEEDCNGGGFSMKMAKNGLSLGFTTGGLWSLVEDLKGPSHNQGGIDLYFGNDGTYINNNGNQIKASNGLVIGNNK